MSPVVRCRQMAGGVYGRPPEVWVQSVSDVLEVPGAGCILVVPGAGRTGLLCKQPAFVFPLFPLRAYAWQRATALLPPPKQRSVREGRMVRAKHLNHFGSSTRS